MEGQLPTITITGGMLAVLLGALGWYINKKYEASQKRREEERASALLTKKALEAHIKDCNDRAVANATLKADVEHLKTSINEVKTGQEATNSKIDQLNQNILQFFVK